MTASATRRKMTPEEADCLPDSVGYELFDGKLKRRVMWVESVWVAGHILARLSRYADTHGGWVFGAGLGVNLWPESARTFVRPDISFVRPGRFPGERLPTDTFLTIPPDVVAEVISPTESAEYLDRKKIMYLDAGIRAVWMVYPLTRRILVHRPGESIKVFPDGSVLDGGSELPGFACDVASLFLPGT